MAARRPKKPATPKRYRYKFLVPDGYGRRGNLEFESAADVTAAGNHVRHMLARLRDGEPYEEATYRWLEKLDDRQHGKLAEAGFVSPRNAAKPEPRTIGSLTARYLATKVDAKPATIDKLRQAGDDLTRYPKFGADTLVASVTAGQAREWVAWLRKHGNVRDKQREDLDDNTVRRRTGLAKQIFGFAIELGWIEKNPFVGLVAAVQANEDRMEFIDQERIAKVIGMAPDARWRAIIALARFGGLRVPSELARLRWCDIDFEAGRVLVHAPKTEHHKGKGRRHCPLFPELRPYLEDLCEIVRPGENVPAESLVFEGIDGDKNLRQRMLRLIKKAGVAPWPKLFQNLRASRETELLAIYPAKDVCAWIGNSVPVAMKHYAMATEDVLRRAARDGATLPGTVPIGKDGTLIGTLSGVVRSQQESSNEAGGVESPENSGESDDSWRPVTTSPGVGSRPSRTRTGSARDDQDSTKTQGFARFSPDQLPDPARRLVELVHSLGHSAPQPAFSAVCEALAGVLQLYVTSLDDSRAEILRRLQAAADAPAGKRTGQRPLSAEELELYTGPAQVKQPTIGRRTSPRSRAKS